MARGGLSSDPVKRARQLAGLKRGNERAIARLTELETSPSPAGDDSPAKSDDSPADVERVDYTPPKPKPGKAASRSRAKPARKPGKPRARSKPPADDSPAAEPELPGFLGGLRAPFSRTYDRG